MLAEQMPDLLIVGVVFLIGWAAHVVGSKAHIPRVSLLLSIGIVTGPAVLDLVPYVFTEYFSTVTHLALAMIGFLLGESFVGRDILVERRQVLLLSLGASLFPAITVFGLVFLVSEDLVFAMVLAGIATATDPAATLDVIREARAKGTLSQTLKGVVAVDDAWGIIIFSLLLVAANMISGNGNSTADILHGVWEVCGALILGVAIGFPMSVVIGRHRLGEPTIVEAMGFVFVCGGIALYLELSYLLACMMLGATVARRAKHVEKPFHAIEKVSDPFLVVFFILSGVSLTPSSLTTLSVVGAVYVLARCIGKILGIKIFAYFAHSPPVVVRHLGACLLPQAGVAIGLALLVGERFPNIGESVLTLTIATTVLFELAGPLVTRWNLFLAGETMRKS
jgi:Kef-type K+ transport system membrane component KefB